MTCTHTANRPRSGRLGPAVAVSIFAALSGSVPAAADQPQIGTATEQRIAVPGTSFQFDAASARRLLERRDDSEALLGALMSWISNASGLPNVQTVPRVKFSPPEAIVALHSNELAGWRATMPKTASHAEQQTVVAVYDSATATIHLPNGWTGRTAGELSILVHEMVHHLQYANGLKFECPQAREKTAYDIQQRWLALFGRDLNRDFAVDPFTLLVRTKCFY